MASIDLHKCHGGEASAFMRHDFRHDGKETGYRNKDIAYSLPAPVWLTLEQTRRFFELAYRDILCPFAGGRAKHFMTRERLHKIQQNLDDLCVREFGVHYLTGEGRRDPRHSTNVEELKQVTASKELEQLQQTSKDDFYHSLATCYKDMQSEHPERFDNNFYMGVEYAREQAQKNEPDISDSADLGLFPDVADDMDGDFFDWGDR